MIKSTNKKIWKIYFLDLIVLTLIFVGLYHSFIFGGQMYAYADIGADTINQYLPATVFELDSLKEGIGGVYDLQFGLGRYSGGYLLKYLNPANLALLVFGKEYLHIGLLVAMYLKYAAICLFSLLFFVRLLKNEKAAAVCALLWTYSGYAVLWGQHYNFLSSTLAFTVAVYGFQLFLENDRKKLLVVPAMAFLPLISYYHLYMACYFLLIYGVLYLAFQKNSFLQILKKAGWFVLAMIPAVCIAAGSLLPAIADFLDSFRTDQVTQGIGGMSLIYEPSVILSFAARFLSNNLIGVGNNFRGPVNYYECAILSVSLLFIFAFVYLMQRKHWKRVLGITVACVILLCIPFVSRMIVFTTENQRWTYLLCFAQVIAIGFALSDILAHWKEEGFQKIFLRTVIISDVLLAMFAGVMIWQDRRVGGNWLDLKACITLVLIAFLYHVAFLLMYKTKKVFQILLAAVALELLMGNYATVNDRETITVDEWYNDMYNDGTAQVVQWIQEQDDSLYRINKTYYSAYYTDSLIQGYNGMGTYKSTNSAELVNLARSYGYSNARNWLGFDGSDVLANTTLGVKYIIARSGTYMNPEYFEGIYDDGTYAVYKNRYWLGFGYLYQEEMTESTIPYSTTLEKAMQLTQAYYVTETVEASEDPEINGTKAVDLLPYLTDSYQCDVVTQGNGLKLTGTSQDMLLYFDLPELEEDWMVSGVRIKMTTQSDSRIKLFTATDSYDFCVEHYDSFSYQEGSGVYYLDNTVPEKVNEIRLDVSEVAQDITIESVELLLADGQKLQENLKHLQENCVTDLTQEGSTFRGTVINPENSSAMLCVPLIYSDHWEAAVDGQPVKTVNINGGLVGLEVGSGEHNITLVYQNNTYTVGAIVTVVSTVAFVFIALALRQRRRKRN